MRVHLLKLHWSGALWVIDDILYLVSLGCRQRMCKWRLVFQGHSLSVWIGKEPTFCPVAVFIKYPRHHNTQQQPYPLTSLSKEVKVPNATGSQGCLSAFEARYWYCMFYLFTTPPFYVQFYHSTNRSRGLFQKSYKWTNQIAAFAIEACWLSKYSSCIANDVDVMFQNGHLCWQNAVIVNGCNSLNSKLILKLK